MNSETQLKVQAYLDNELSPGEARKIAALLNSDTELRHVYTELKDTRQFVTENEPERRLPEGRDFYWSKIQREISRTEQIAPRAPSPWWMRFIAPVAGAIALFAILLSVSGPSGGRQAKMTTTLLDPTAPLHEGQVVTPDMSSITFRSEAEGVTVVWYLLPMPNNRHARSYRIFMQKFARSFALVTCLAAILGLFVPHTGAADQPVLPKYTAILVWGTDGDKPPEKELKDVDEKLTEKFRKIFKWKNYYEVTRKDFELKSGELKQIELSHKCEVRINLTEKEGMEVELIGGQADKKKSVYKGKQSMPLKDILILAGDDKNATAWFVVLKPQ